MGAKRPVLSLSIGACLIPPLEADSKTEIPNTLVNTQAAFAPFNAVPIARPSFFQCKVFMCVVRRNPGGVLRGEIEADLRVLNVARWVVGVMHVVLLGEFSRTLIYRRFQRRVTFSSPMTPCGWGEGGGGFKNPILREARGVASKRKRANPD